MDEREYNNIMQVKELFKEIVDAIYAGDIDRLKEIKGELKAMESIVTPLEFTMGMTLSALSHYQRKTKIFEADEEEENDSKRKK